MNSRYLVRDYPSKPDQTVSVIGGKALQLRKIDPVLVPNWVAITSDCPEDRISATVFKAWTHMSVNSYQTYAVRSSAVGEDGKNQSFAGIFESKLNVRPTGLEHAVREVRDSVKDERVTAYVDTIMKTNSKYPRPSELPQTPAVIIMPMIDARYSGVLFTKEPVEGTDRMLLEYEQGVGGVVDGTGDSMTFFLDRNNFYETSVIDEELTHSHPPPAIRRIWEEAKRLERNYGRPVDIEWAVDQNDKPWILQVRPITAGVTA